MGTLTIMATRIRKKIPVSRAWARHRTRPTAISVVALGLMLAGSPLAAQEAGNEADYLKDLRDCRAIATAEDRLACFDREVGEILAATDSGEVQVVDREAIRETRRGLFGFSLPKLGVFGSNDDEELDLMETEITGVRRLRGDAYIIKVAAGSTWQINDAPMRLRPPRVGDPVVLKKASLGSYFIRIDGQLGVKGRRIE